MATITPNIFDTIEDPDELAACRSEFLDWFDNTEDGLRTIYWLHWQSAWRAARRYQPKAPIMSPDTEMLEAIRFRATQLTELARMAGVVLTIHLEPRKPLSMGNHTMTVAVRPARQLSITEDA